MYVDFNTLSPISRVWIYQANRAFTPSEQESIAQELTFFTNQWSVHGTPVNASYKIVLNQFIVLSVDEKGPSASGCSIDSSVHFLQELEAKYQVSLLNKSDVAFQRNNEVKIFPFNKVKEAVAEGLVKKGDYYFNNTITQLQDLEKDWKQSVENSWVAKYF